MSEKENLEPVTKETSVAPKAPAKAKKAAKTDDKKKPGFFARIGRWLRELKVELKKVQWPTRKQTINNTLIVIACVVVVGLFIWVFDFVATNAIDLLISLLG